MVEPVILSLFANEIALKGLIGGLRFLVELKNRVDLAFTHAKTRTKKLADAAEDANNFLQLFEGTVESLQGVFDENRRKLLVPPLTTLQRTVREAHTMMQDLEGKSKARWFAQGNTYRERITKATVEVSRLRIWGNTKNTGNSRTPNVFTAGQSHSATGECAVECQC